MKLNRLFLKAGDRAGKRAACSFTVKADDITELENKGTTVDPAFDIPDGTSTVSVAFKPGVVAFWGGVFTLSVAADGSLTVAPPSSPDDEDLRNRVALLTMPAAMTTPIGDGRATLAVVKVSQFRDRTEHVRALLKKPPTRRCIWHPELRDPDPPHKMGVFRMDNVDEVKTHTDFYGKWAPDDWKLPGVPKASVLDVDAPLTAGNALNFLPAGDSSPLDSDCVVLERAGPGMSPRYFAVAWPGSIAPKADADSTPFLLYIRQILEGNKYDLQGKYINSPGCKEGGQLEPYPDNFDYADGMFESLHFASTSLRFPDSKGVPYQAREAGADVVSVIPCNSYTMASGFKDLSDPQQTETVLQEVQAYMFWKAGVATPPKSIGKTAVAAFSSGNFILNNWLKDPDKRTSHFFSSIVSAVYFLEPLRNAKKDGKWVDVLDGFVTSALEWSKKNADKRIRVYMQWQWPALQKLIDAPLHAPPHFDDSSDGRRTVAVIPNAAWIKAFTAAGRRPPLDWTVIHHAIAGTMLTHALSPHDPAGRDI